MVVGSSVAFAYWLDDVIAGLEIVWKVASMMGVAFWLGLFWRKTTVAGAWASTLSGFAMWWLTTRDSMLDLLDELPFSQELQFVVETGSGLSIYLPWQMFFYLTAALMAGVLVSLFTRPVDGSKLDTFYALTRTPVTGEAESKAPCTLPEGAVIPPRRVLFDSSYWEIPIPSRKSIAGFAIGWLLVGAIVSVFYMIARG